MTEAAAAAPGRTPAQGTTGFARRASNLLAVLGMAALGVAVFVVVPSSAVLPLRVIAGALSAATGVAMLLLSFALDRRRAWAPASAAAVLWIVLAMGVFRAVAGVLNGGIWVPLDAIAAAWALSGSGRPIARPRDSALAWVLVGLVLVGRVGEPVVGTLFTPGVSRFAVAASELTVQVAAVCPGPSAAPGTGPVRIRVDGAWAWAQTDLLPSGTDGIGIGWTGTGGPPWSSEVTSVIPDGYLWSGGGGAAAGVVGRELEGVAAGNTWGVAVDRGGLRDGRVTLDLVGPAGAGGAPQASGTVSIRMVYAHLDRWVVAAETTCSW